VFSKIHVLKLCIEKFQFSTIIIFNSIDTRKPSSLRAPSEQWSGEATRTSGFMVEDTRVDVTIGDESPDDNTMNHRKERPIWMMESTVLNSDGSQVYSLSYFFREFSISLL